MMKQRHLWLSGLLLCWGALGLALVSCQQSQEVEDTPDWSGIFGNGYKDLSIVICEVGDVKITENDLERRYEELPSNLKSRFRGEGWESRFLRYMVDEVLLVQEAMGRKLYRKPTISQMLISQFRTTMKRSIQDFELIKDQEPTAEQVQAFYEQNIDSYIREGRIHARVIVCQNKETAFLAYDQIRELEDEDPQIFLKMVARYSTNFETAKQGGDLGWFGPRGFIPAFTYGLEFAETVWDWTIDIHEPVEISGRWHIVEILDKDYERHLSLEEARDRVMSDLAPIHQEELVEAFLRQAKRDTPIEYYGDYRPGGGLSPQELFERAWYANTPEQKIDFFKLLIEEYPENELTDDALFMIANIYYDSWGDIPFASRYLGRLMREYPESELYGDAEYIMYNMSKRSYQKPESVEDLRPRPESQ